MKVFLCRWPNGDVSLAAGKSRSAIEDVLDEAGSPEMGAEMIPLDDHAFALHFKLKRSMEDPIGVIEALQFSSMSWCLEEHFDKAYPILAKVSAEAFELQECGDEIDEKKIFLAPEMERSRVEQKDTDPDWNEEKQAALTQKFKNTFGANPDPAPEPDYWV